MYVCAVYIYTHTHLYVGAVSYVRMRGSARVRVFIIIVECVCVCVKSPIFKGVSLRARSNGEESIVSVACAETTGRVAACVCVTVIEVRQKALVIYPLLSQRSNR